MKSRMRLNRYNAFKKQTKSWCSHLKEDTTVSNCITRNNIPIFKVRVFQNGTIKMDVQKPKRINPQWEVFGIDGNDNIVGSKESIERVFGKIKTD